MVLHGHTHGGIAQGVGQALWESCSHDMLPAFTTEISEVPWTTHPLGLRGGGEGGTTPALAAQANAICDALADLGVEHIERPATAERVGRAIRDAGRDRLAGPRGRSAARRLDSG